MDLRHIRYFLAVAEELHFRRAAKRLHISQPPLSSAIRELEDELGVQLFERTTRRVSLTDEGVAFRDDTRRLLHDLQVATDRVRAIGAGLTGELSVGFVGAATFMGVPEAIRRFRQNAPSVRLILDELFSSEIERRLLSGQLDVGFVRVLDEVTAGLEHRPFVRESYTVAIPPGHRLAQKTHVVLQDLHGEPLLFFPRRFHPTVYDAWFDAFRRAEVEPQIVQEIHTVQTERTLVLAGMGLALTPASGATDGRSGIHYLPLVGDIPDVRVDVVWDPLRRRPARDRFLSTLVPPSGELRQVATAPPK